MRILVDDPIEFPDCTTIRCRTAAFQRRFVEHFMTLYSCLPVSVQVSALSVAVRRHSSGPASHVEPSSLSYSTDMFVSLHQYLGAAASCVDVPLQLPASEYALTVYPDHFDLVRRARVDGCADPAGLARQIVADVAGEAATELARAFEYQIVLLGDDEGLSARLGAKRGAERAVDYLKTTSRHVDVNSLIRGVVEGPPAAAPQTVSAIIGRHHELHWNLDDMFQRPGLRRERLLVAREVDALGGYGTPWRFYASTSGTDAILYGYRSQLLERDFHSEWLRGGRQKSYRLNIDEEAAYDVEVPWRSDDFHRTYRPYRRLVGSAVMASYASRSVEDKSTISLSQFVQRLHGDAFCRDEVESVFRPLTPDFRRESFSAVVLRNSINDSGTNPASTLLTSRGICCEASIPSSNSMPESHASTGDTPLLSDSKHIQELFISTQSSMSDKSLSVCDGTLRSQFPVGSNRPLTLHAFCTDALIHGTNSTTGACNGNMSEVNQSRDVTAAEQQLSAKRRPPPPVVKPKPSLELRRRLSVTGPATTSGGSQSMTSLPVNQRQSSVPVDRSDSTADVTVRFPTLDELFGRELAAMGLASGSTDNQNS